MTFDVQKHAAHGQVCFVWISYIHPNERTSTERHTFILYSCACLGYSLGRAIPSTDYLSTAWKTNNWWTLECGSKEVIPVCIICAAEALDLVQIEILRFFHRLFWLYPPDSWFGVTSGRLIPLQRQNARSFYPQLNDVPSAELAIGAVWCVRLL